MTATTSASASVIVCAYTEARWDVLREAVEATLAQRPAPLEVLLVVDHNDALRRRCEAELTPDVRVIANEDARGLSGARNTGVRHARGDVIAFLDDDAVPQAGWLHALLEPYTGTSVMGVGGHVAPRWADARPAWLPPEFWWTVGCSYRGLPTGPAPIRNAIGANMSFRRSAFAVAGGFTEGIGRLGATPLGCEETEFAIRLRQRRPDAMIVYAPSARVEHMVTPDRARWRYFASRCWSEGRSKALVTREVGAGDALSSERAYTLRTLPSGIVRGLRDLARGERAGAARAGTILAGLAMTTAGYVAGRAAQARSR
jgi:glycosyltransferase involved in cell wall biosynthesis